MLAPFVQNQGVIPRLREAAGLEQIGPDQPLTKTCAFYQDLIVWRTGLKVAIHGSIDRKTINWPEYNRAPVNRGALIP